MKKDIITITTTMPSLDMAMVKLMEQMVGEREAEEVKFELIGITSETVWRNCNRVQEYYYRFTVEYEI